MALLKLTTTDAFVVRDFDDDVPAFGIVRLAPKILQSGAKELARSQTYQCAVFNMKCQGASAGINATPETSDEAIAAFVAEMLPLAASGALMLDPAKGVPADALSELFRADPRNEAHTRFVDGMPNCDHLLALGAVASAEAARPLDGRRVAIENYDHVGPCIAQAAAERGASVTAVSTSAGTIVDDSGFDIDALRQARDAHGTDLVSAFADEPLPGWRILGADADVLFAGSKMGLISHQGAPNVKAELVVPTGPVPYTTKGAIMLDRQGVTVLPDIVTTAGAMFASMPPDGDDQESIEASVVDLLGTLTGMIVGGDQSPILEACHRAEAFMRTWRDELPFGRPFAA